MTPSGCGGKARRPLIASRESSPKHICVVKAAGGEYLLSRQFIDSLGRDLDPVLIRKGPSAILRDFVGQNVESRLMPDYVLDEGEERERELHLQLQLEVFFSLLSLDKFSTSPKLAILSFQRVSSGCGHSLNLISRH